MIHDVAVYCAVMTFPFFFYLFSYNKVHIVESINIFHDPYHHSIGWGKLHCFSKRRHFFKQTLCTLWWGHSWHLALYFFYHLSFIQMLVECTTIKSEKRKKSRSFIKRWVEGKSAGGFTEGLYAVNKNCIQLTFGFRHGSLNLGLEDLICFGRKGRFVARSPDQLAKFDFTLKYRAREWSRRNADAAILGQLTQTGGHSCN